MFTRTPTTELSKAVLYVLPKKIYHTGAVIVGVGEEIMVVKFAESKHGLLQQGPPR